MSTLKSSNENLTLNADGSGNDIKFQSNGVEKASLTDGGVFTATSFTGSGANLTSLPADSTKLSLSGGAMTGAITTNSTFDGVDIATRDAVLTSTTTTANAALPKTGGSMSGNLTMNANEIIGDDNAEIRLGTSTDLKFYHDGNHSYIKETGTGSLKMWTSQLEVLSANGNENQIVAAENGAVDLYYDNSKKFETTSGGVDVTGTITADGLTVDGDVVIQKASGDVSLTLAANENSSSREPSIFLKGYNTSSNPAIQFGDNGGYAGSIQYENSDNSMRFAVNGGEEMRLESDGDLHVDGDVIAYSTTISDERLKDNIEIVDSALDKVKELKGVTFTRKQDGVESAGVIAQDVEKVLPQAVKHKALPLQTGDDELFKTVQYDALHALLIEAVKELSEKVEKLENK